MTYEIHELAGIVALASEAEQLALTEDIRANGLQDDIVLWDDGTGEKVVDGRCRQIACVATDTPITTRVLSPELDYATVAKIVKSLNTRRNLTDTQKVMSALKQYQTTKGKQSDIAKQWAVGHRTLQNAVYIAKHRPEYIDPLFNGNSIKVYDSTKGITITTNKVTGIAKVIKTTEEMNVTEDTSNKVEWSSDAYIKTEAGKAWYYTSVAMDNITTDNIATRMKYAELANYKFKVEEK